MAWIKWTAAMSVGLAILDEDHQKLIGLINRLDNAPIDARASTVVIRDVIDELLRYTVFHFEREEAVMRACGYPDLDAHQHEHRLLTREVGDLRRRASEDALSRDEVALFLVDWLNHHILLQDMDYRVHVEGHPNAVAIAGGLGELGIGRAPSASAAPY